MKKMQQVLSVIFVLLLLISCGKEKEEAAEVPAETYQVSGLVVSISEENNTVTIAHEDIPGFMSGMTMGFRVKDPTLLEGLQPQDSIHFELTVTTGEDGEMWVSDIQKME